MHVHVVAARIFAVGSRFPVNGGAGSAGRGNNSEAEEYENYKQTEGDQTIRETVSHSLLQGVQAGRSSNNTRELTQTGEGKTW